MTGYTHYFEVARCIEIMLDISLLKQGLGAVRGRGQKDANTATRNLKPVPDTASVQCILFDISRILNCGCPIMETGIHCMSSISTGPTEGIYQAVNPG